MASETAEAAAAAAAAVAVAVTFADTVATAEAFEVSGMKRRFASIIP